MGLGGYCSGADSGSSCTKSPSNGGSVQLPAPGVGVGGRFYGRVQTAPPPLCPGPPRECSGTSQEFGCTWPGLHAAASGHSLCPSCGQLEQWPVRPRHLLGAGVVWGFVLEHEPLECPGPAGGFPSRGRPPAPRGLCCSVWLNSLEGPRAEATLPHVCAHVGVRHTHTRTHARPS